MKPTMFLSLLFFFHHGYAAIIYTDVSPDLVTVPSSAAQFDVDMNNNASPDFRFTCVDISGLKFIIAQAGQIGLSNHVLIDTTGGTYFARALTSNASIGPVQFVWHSMAATNPTLLSDFLGTYGGLWLNSQDYYLGVRFMIGANTHYGWIRMNIVQSTSVVTLKDYAYESTPNTAISAGAMPAADVATAIQASDIDENSNGSDMLVTFNKAANELTVSEYRIIAVKDTVTSFGLAAAQALGPASFEVVMPSGSNVSKVLNPTIRDSDGDDLSIGVLYRVYVLSKADTSVIANDGLSLPSSPVQLNTRADVTTSIVCSDVANNVNGTDLQISFTKAVKENTVFKYRIIILKSADAATYSLTDAQSIATSRYTDVTPAGSDKVVTLSSFIQDKDGQAITDNVAYKAVILSLSNGLLSNLDSLSPPSNEITLTDKALGFSDLAEKSGYFYASPAGIEIFLPRGFQNAGFRLYDMTGKLLLSTECLNEHSVIERGLIRGYCIGVLTSDGNVVSKLIVF